MFLKFLLPNSLLGYLLVTNLNLQASGAKPVSKPVVRLGIWSGFDLRLLDLAKAREDQKIQAQEKKLLIKKLNEERLLRVQQELAAQAALAKQVARAKQKKLRATRVSFKSHGLKLDLSHVGSFLDSSPVGSVVPVMTVVDSTLTSAQLEALMDRASHNATPVPVSRATPRFCFPVLETAREETAGLDASHSEQACALAGIKVAGSRARRSGRTVGTPRERGGSLENL